MGYIESDILSHKISDASSNDVLFSAKPLNELILFA